MSMLITQPAQAISLPEPRTAIAIRPATMADVPFMDSLQKLHSRQVGYFPTKQFEGYVQMGGVMVAEGCEDEARPSGSATPAGRVGIATPAGRVGAFAAGERASPVALPHGRASLGYIISRDRYLKRDELGVIYQLCVVPGERRKLVGAALLREVFERSAYGCRLYCCWCAQDIEANHFWESMGFVPIAFRGGSATKRRGGGGGRVHIFWQKRIRAGDNETPYWFPAKTDGGAMREDRLVLPIPPHLHWSDEMPVLEPADVSALPDEGAKPRRHGGTKGKTELVPGMKCGPQEPTRRPRAGVQFGPPGAESIGHSEQLPEKPAQAERSKPARQKQKCDPKLIAAARELRDRYLEEANRNPHLLLPQGKYEVARQLPELQRVEVIRAEIKQLPQAA